MYKERRETISIKFYILIALVILIIVFAIILLIPHKKEEVKEPVEMELYSKQDMAEIKKSYSATFYDNLKTLKTTSEKYFIKKQEALLNQQTVTLDKLINDNHMITTLYDEEGNKCDEENSGVAYTKNSNNSNYKMVITLICGEESVTLGTYMGSYDYCEDSDYCEKQVEVKKNEPTPAPEPTPEPTPEPLPEPAPTPEPTPSENGEYNLYEYALTPSDNIGDWSEWSEWSTTEPEASLYTEIDSKVDSKQVEYDCSDARTERYIISYKEEQFLAGYTSTTTKVGTKKTSDGSIQAVYETKKVPIYGKRRVPVYGTRTTGGAKTCTKDDSVTSYRYRTFSYKKGINYVRYSSSDNDQYLISKGYAATGKTK